MTVKVSVTVTQVLEDGSEGPVDGELAAALVGPVQQFAGMLTWTARQAGRLDHGEREKAVAESGRELQRQVLEATFAIDCAREERGAPLTSGAGIRTPWGCGNWRPSTWPRAGSGRPRRSSRPAPA